MIFNFFEKFNFFITEEAKQYNIAIKLLERSFEIAKTIVSLDDDQYPHHMTRLVFEYNEYYNSALRILHELNLSPSHADGFEEKIFKKILPKLEMDKESKKIITLIPKYVFTKKEYTKFEKIMMGK